MIAVATRVRDWGNSVGIIIPKETAVEENIKAGDEITLLIAKKNNVLRKTFGTLKLKRSTEEILKEVDQEAWND